MAMRLWKSNFVYRRALGSPPSQQLIHGSQGRSTKLKPNEWPLRPLALHVCTVDQEVLIRHMFMHTKNNETLENAHNHRHTWIELNIEIQQRLHQIIVDAVLARPTPHFHRGTLQKTPFLHKGWTDHWKRLLKDSNNQNAIILHLISNFQQTEVSQDLPRQKLLPNTKSWKFYHWKISKHPLVDCFFLLLLLRCQPIITSFAYG